MARENEREGETENERRKRENKHAPNRLAIERDGKKRKRGRNNCAQGKTQENKREKGERELEKAGSHKRQ